MMCLRVKSRHDLLKGKSGDDFMKKEVKGMTPFMAPLVMTSSTVMPNATG